MKSVKKLINLSKSDKYLPGKTALSAGHCEAFGRFVQQGFCRLWYDRLPIDVEDKARVSLKSYTAGDICSVPSCGLKQQITIALRYEPYCRGKSFTSTLTLSLPAPTPEGVFCIDGVPMVFPAIAIDEGTDGMSRTRLCHIDTALGAALGESLAGFLSAVEERIRYGAAEDMTPDELSAGIPVQESIDAFFHSSPLLERLDETNPAAALAHIRRVRRLKLAECAGIADRKLREVHYGMYGRLDSFSTPEGPDVGLSHTLSVWAETDDQGMILTPYEVMREGKPTGEIRLLSAEEDFGKVKVPWNFIGIDGDSYTWARKDDKILPVAAELVELRDISPTKGLSHLTILTPFLGSDDGHRAMLAANMMTEAISVEGRELPWVMSGAEEAVALWSKADSSYTVDGCLALGANVLVAFLPWMGYNYEDAIVVSSALVERGTFTSLNNGIPQPLQVGDKLANRHGLKGIVAKIVDQSEMPRLPDGTPIEMLLNPMGVPSRMTFGPILEASAGMAAAALGAHVVSPPYCGAAPEEIKDLLRTAGLPETGMFPLTIPGTGGTADQPVTAGYQYMLKLKDTASAALSFGEQKIGLSEIMAMAAYGASSNIENALAEPAAFRDFATVAGAAHINISADGGGLKYSFADESQLAGEYPKLLTSPKEFRDMDESEQGRIELPVPVDHPWVGDRAVNIIPVPPKKLMDEGLQRAYHTLLRAVMAQRDVMDADSPEILVRNGRARLREAVGSIFGTPCGNSGLGRLLRKLSTCIGESRPKSFRAVIVPGPELSLTECGIPREALDRFGAGEDSRQVLLNRTPTLHQQSLQALTPVPEGSRAIRIHPMACWALDSDFDGDQAAVYLLNSDECAEEAKSLMTPARNIYQTRSGDILVIPTQEMVYGLAFLSGTAEGRARIAEVLPDGVAIPEGDITKSILKDILCGISRRLGVKTAIETAERLMRIGFAAATVSGISVGLGSIPSDYPSIKKDIVNKANAEAEKVWRYKAAAEELRQIWSECAGELWEKVVESMSGTQGPARELLRVADSGARGNRRQLAQLIGARGLLEDLPAMESFAEGNSAWAHFISSFGVRRGLINQYTRDLIETRLRRELLLRLADIQIVEDSCSPSPAGRLRSPLSCICSGGICAECYGEDPASGATVKPGRAVGILAAFAVTQPLPMMSVESHEELLRILDKIQGADDLPALVDRLMAVYDDEKIPMMKKHAEIVIGGLAGRWATGRVLERLLEGGEYRLTALAEAAAENRAEPLGIRESLLAGRRPPIS